MKLLVQQAAASVPAGNGRPPGHRYRPRPDRKQVHEARQIRNAEAVAPGVVRRTLDDRLAQDQEPTKAAIREAVSNVLHLGNRMMPQPPEGGRGSQRQAESAGVNGGRP